MRRRLPEWPDILLPVILALLPGLFFWPLIAPNPADRLQIKAGDFTGQYFPLRAFTAREWVAGRVPLWNPSIFGGQPALADIQSGALYPPHVFEALLTGWGGWGFPLWALELQAIAHLSLAAVGAYLLGRYFAGRRRGKRAQRPARFAGVIVSLAFTYGGYLTGFPVQQLTILEVSAWLPWVIWLLGITLDRVTGGKPRRESLAAAAWTALVLALAILAGHPQTALYVFYVSLAYAAFRACWAWREAAPPRRLPLTLSVFGYWSAVVVLGLALSAAQLLPTLEFIRRSLRAELNYEAVSSGLPLNELVAVVYPGFFGGSPQYVGVVTMVLVGLALAVGRPRSQVWFWGGLGLIAMLLAFGANTFLYPLFYLLAPGFDAVRQQERAFLVYSFAASILAGQGALVIARPLPFSIRSAYYRYQRGLGRVAIAALALTGLYVYGATVSNARGDEVNLFFGVLRHHIFGLIVLAGTLILLALRPRRRFWRGWGLGLLAAWMAFNLFSVNWRFNLAQPNAESAFQPNRLVQFLQREAALQPGPVRIASGGLLPGGHNAASVFGLLDVTGNTPLQLAQSKTFAGRIPAWRFWQLMSIRYIVDERDLDERGLRRVFEGKGLKVYEVTDPFPFARLVRAAEVVPEAEAAMARLGADAFDLAETAVLGAPLAGIELRQPGAARPAAAARVTHFRPSAFSINVETDSGGLLVLSQINYPGWQATVDDQAVEIVPANVIFQGMPLTAGSHTVRLVFSPASFKVGALVSGLGLLVAGGLVAAGLRLEFRTATESAARNRIGCPGNR